MVICILKTSAKSQLKVTNKSQTTRLVICVSAEPRKASTILNFLSKNQTKANSSPVSWKWCRFYEPLDIAYSADVTTATMQMLASSLTCTRAPTSFSTMGLGWAQLELTPFSMQRAKGYTDTTCQFPAGLCWIRASQISVITRQRDIHEFSL